MGQLRNGILGLQKTCLNMEPQIAAVEEQQEEYTNRVYEAAKRIEEGLNALVLYLITKLKKEGRNFDTDGGKPLKGDMDSTVITFAKGIGQAKTDVKAIIGKLAAAQKTSVGALMGSIDESTATMSKLKGIADKKKAKWLKSDKYKAKISGYLAALTAVDGILKKQAEVLKGLEGLNQNDAWVERNYKFSQDMTLKQVRGLASIALESNLKDYNANKQAIKGRAKQFRDEYKSLAGQFGMMKKWVEDADGMEAESEEK